jgi:hypothetical protein
VQAYAATKVGIFGNDFIGSAANFAIQTDIASPLNETTTAKDWTLGKNRLIAEITTPNLVIDGDSIAAGYAGSGYPTTIYSQSLTWTGSNRNVAVPGFDLNSLRHSAVARADALISQFSPVNVLVIWGGINGLATNGLAETERQIMNYCLDRRRAGWDRIVVVPIASWPSNEGNRMSYDAWLQINWWRFADEIVETAGVPEIWGNNASLNLTYFNANGHPNDAGFAKVLPVLQAALDRVLLTSSDTGDFRKGVIRTYANGHVSIGLLVDAGVVLGVNGGALFSGQVQASGPAASLPGFVVAEAGLRSFIMEAYQGDLFFYNTTDGKFLLTLRSTGIVEMPNLPTSSAGLTTGQCWADPAAANVVKRVP